MRLYHRTEDDLANGLQRCIAEAGDGRVAVALARIRDLRDEFPRTCHVPHTEGIIRRDYLGQGQRATDCFSQAYELDPSLMLAAFNVAFLAPDPDTFQLWKRRVLKLDPQEQSVRALDETYEADAASGAPHWRSLIDRAHLAREAGEQGGAAALMEVALQTADLELEDELALRRARAQDLRALDDAEMRHRNVVLEAFPADERLALQEAMTELDRALELNEDDAELWNLKAAWCLLLSQFAEAEGFAQRAIRLRPQGYPKPWLNQTLALVRQKKRKQAKESAAETLKQATDREEYARDAKEAERLLASLEEQPPEPGLETLGPVFERLIRGATLAAEKETGQRGGAVPDLVRGFMARVHGAGGGLSSHACVPLVAELLSDFSPEMVYTVVMTISQTSARLYDNCMNAVLFVAAQSEGVRQRDAARVVVLSLLGAPQPAAIPLAYRRAVLEPAAVEGSVLSGLEGPVRDQLERINPLLPELIGDQDPVDDAGKQRAQRAILDGLSEATPSGCSTSSFVLGVLLMAALIAYGVWVQGC